jgi:hypothetical protein
VKYAEALNKEVTPRTKWALCESERRAWHAQKYALEDIENPFGESRNLEDWERPGFKNLVSSIEKDGLWWPLSCVGVDERVLKNYRVSTQDHCITRVNQKLRKTLGNIGPERKFDHTKPLLWTGTQRFEALKRAGFTHVDIIIVEYDDAFWLRHIENLMMEGTHFRFT